MIDHIAKLFAGKASIGTNGVPVLFVHVITGPNFGMTFAKLYGQFRIAFDVEMRWIGNAGEQEQFFAHLKNQGILAEGQALRYAGFSQAIIANILNIHGKRLMSLLYEVILPKLNLTPIRICLY